MGTRDMAGVWPRRATAAALGLSAFLIFSVQFLFAKMIAPVFGGAGAAWTTSIAFFQLTLFAGYAYAHLIAQRLSLRWQMIIHGLVFLSGAAALPIAAPAMDPPNAAAPQIALFFGFVMAIGAPFFALAANAPLLQHWHARAGGGAPYALYAASNAGSLAALIAYPLLAEPLMGLSLQSRIWSGLYLVMGAVALGLGAFAMRGGVPPATAAAESAPPAPVRLRRRLHWLALAFVPAALLISVTNFIMTDIGSAPFLWAPPLALYLLTFILAFTRGPGLNRRLVAQAQAATLIVAIAAPLLFPERHLVIALAHLAAFFAAGLMLHQRLYDLRPEDRNLTRFYLYLSGGGVAGGLFAAILAPLLFDRVIEYPAMLLAACLLRPGWGGTASGADARPTRRAWLFDLAAPAAGLAAVAALSLTDFFFDAPRALYWAAAGGLVAAAALVSFRPLGFAGAVLALMLFAQNGVLEALSSGGGGARLLHAARSFYGTHYVYRLEPFGVTTLAHGGAVHNIQLSGRDARVPLTYYYAEGPFGDALSRLRARRGPLRTGVAGLGAGALACLKAPGERWVYYEIDPAIAATALDTDYFRYLNDCAAGDDIIVNDARIAIAREPERAFDALILDAYLSDAPPAHLLTREAMALFMSKLKEGGVLLFHVSSNRLDLPSVVMATAQREGLSHRLSAHERPWEDRHALFKYKAVVIAVGRESDLAALFDDSDQWVRAAPDSRISPWTDDYSNLLAALIAKIAPTD